VRAQPAAVGGAHGRTAARPHAGAQRLGPPARSFWGFEEARWVAPWPTTTSTPYWQLSAQRLMSAGRWAGWGAVLSRCEPQLTWTHFVLLCRNVRCQPAEDHQALDVAHGVPPPRAAPPVLRRVVLSDTRCPSGVPVSWSYTGGSAGVRASALPAVVCRPMFITRIQKPGAT